MSKNTNLSFLTDYITADITNGRIGINNTSPAYAFDVVGVAKFSSSVTATSFNATTTNIFAVDGTERMRITSGGFVGLGVTPNSNWYSSWKVLQLGNSGNIHNTGTDFNATRLTNGAYYSNSDAWTYLVSSCNPAMINLQADGALTFLNAASGTAGGTFSWNERMRITSAGNVVIGSTTEDASYKVRIVGGLLASNNTTNYAITLQNTSFSAGAHTLFVDAYSSSSSTNALFVRVNDGNTTAMVVKGSGNTLLGTGSDNGERLYVSGSIRATGSITANSDISLKKNLLKIENALEKVEQINGYTYELKEDDSKRHAGVIAQEIQTVLPEIVNTGNDGLMGVEYGNISALLIEAIKELSAEITILKNK